MKKPFYKRWWFAVIVVFLAIGLIGNIATGWEGLEDEPEKITTSAEKPVAQKEPTVEEQVADIIEDKLGKSSNTKKDRIVETNVLELGDGTRNINLTLNASENLSTDFTRKGMWKDSAKILAPLSELDGVANIMVVWQLPLVDQYGNSEDSSVMRINLTAETLAKIDWNGFNYENLQTVAESYYEHPALSK